MNPKVVLVAGGAAYTAGAVWMFTNYYRRSSFKQIFVKTDAAYENVKLMHHP